MNSIQCLQVKHSIYLFIWIHYIILYWFQIFNTF